MSNPRTRPTYPKELREHSQRDAAAVEKLSKAADEYLELQPTWGKVPSKTLSELELGQLRALGYAVP